MSPPPNVQTTKQDSLYDQAHFDEIVAEMDRDSSSKFTHNVIANPQPEAVDVITTTIYSPEVSFQTPQSASSFSSLFGSPRNARSADQNRQFSGLGIHQPPVPTQYDASKQADQDDGLTLLLPVPEKPPSRTTPQPNSPQVTSPLALALPLLEPPTQSTASSIISLQNISSLYNKNSQGSPPPTQPKQSQDLYTQQSPLYSLPSTTEMKQQCQSQTLSGGQQTVNFSSIYSSAATDARQEPFSPSGDVYPIEPSMFTAPNVRFSGTTIARDEARQAKNSRDIQKQQHRSMEHANGTPRHNRQNPIPNQVTSMPMNAPYSGMHPGLPYGMVYPVDPQLVMSIDGRNTFYAVPSMGYQWGNSSALPPTQQQPIFYHAVEPSQMYYQQQPKRPRLHPLQTNGLPQGSRVNGLISEVNDSQILQTPWMRSQTPTSALKPYQKLPAAPLPWGPPERPTLFRYTGQGQWLPSLKFSDEELRSYVQDFVSEKSSTRRQLKAWIQYTPAEKKKSKHLQCRWADCPAPGYEITEGFFRVAFDEFPALRGEELDPFATTGCMHLHCFEKVFDIAQLHSLGIAVADQRTFPFERLNPFVLDNGNILLRQTFRAWAQETLASFDQEGVHRVIEHEDNLWFQLTQTLVDSMPSRLRKHLSEGTNALARHMGDLDSFTQSRRAPQVDRGYKIRDSVVEIIKASKAGDNEVHDKSDLHLVDLESQLKTPTTSAPLSSFDASGSSYKDPSAAAYITPVTGSAIKGKRKRAAPYAESPSAKRHRSIRSSKRAAHDPDDRDEDPDYRKGTDTYYNIDGGNNRDMHKTWDFRLRNTGSKQR
ncbi:hypothetical protein HOO65_060276 [Ceratocystis lukuohia]|uniref:Uncharacterized protein n=1 Tax=Ceratocystis lukuohia TaxID=2019550 RepID=A0ABR4MDV8_9PEZI